MPSYLYSPDDVKKAGSGYHAHEHLAQPHPHQPFVTGMKAGDYAVLIGLLAISLGLGVYRARQTKQDTSQPDLTLNHGTRKLRVLPTLISLLVSSHSAVAILGIPSEYYLFGTQMWLAGDLLATILMPIALERLVVPMIYNLHLTSIYEYYEQRFGSDMVRLFAALLGLLSMLFGVAINLAGPALALETVTGFSMTKTIFILAAISAFYTMLGGTRVVTWSDVSQFFIIIIALCIIIISGSRQMGGISEIFLTGRDHARIFYADFSISATGRLSFWTALTSRVVHTLYLFSVDQVSVQRFYRTPALRSARHTILWLAPSRYVYLTLGYAVGAVSLAYFHYFLCDPLSGGLITTPNQLMPAFITLHFSGVSGMKGLFFASLLGSCLVSTSASIGSGLVTVWKDIVGSNLVKIQIPKIREDFYNFVFMVLLILVATGLAFFVATLPGNLYRTLFTLRGCIDGPLIGLFILGATTAFSDGSGALVGLLAGFATTLTLAIIDLYSTSVSAPMQLMETSFCSVLRNETANILFQPSFTPKGLYPYKGYNASAPALTNQTMLSFMWYIPIGFMTTFLVGIFASAFARLYSGQAVQPVEGKLLLNYRAALHFFEDRTPKSTQHDDVVKYDEYDLRERSRPIMKVRFSDEVAEETALTNDVKNDSVASSSSEIHSSL